MTGLLELARGSRAETQGPLGLTVTDAWCQSNFEAAGGRSFHNAQCKCADPTVALRNVDPALAAAAAANAAVAKQAAISDPSPLPCP